MCTSVFEAPKIIGRGLAKILWPQKRHQTKTLFKPESSLPPSRTPECQHSHKQPQINKSPTPNTNSCIWSINMNFHNMFGSVYIPCDYVHTEQIMVKSNPNYGPGAPHQTSTHTVNSTHPPTYRLTYNTTPSVIKHLFQSPSWEMTFEAGHQAMGKPISWPSVFA